MNLILPDEVPHLPDDVIIGWSMLESFQVNEARFIDQDFIQNNSSRKRRDEHYSSRLLFENLLNEMDLDPKSVNLHKRELGKPYAEYRDELLYLSFSHSHDWVVCGLSFNKDIGLDCEPLTREVNPRIFKRILDESEQWILDEQSELAVWTMKEAIVKCLGIGIRTSLQAFKIQKYGDMYTVFWEGQSIFVLPFVHKNHQLSIAWKS